MNSANPSLCALILGADFAESHKNTAAGKSIPHHTSTYTRHTHRNYYILLTIESMTESNEATAMEVDTTSNQTLQLPWVEKYRPKR